MSEFNETVLSSADPKSHNDSTPLVIHPDHVSGWLHSPKAAVEKAYQGVLTGEMQTMPFCNFKLPIYATPFVIFDSQWLGVLLTPWTLTVLIFAGPDQTWSKRSLADKLAIEIGGDNYTFMINEEPTLGQYLACSLLSPVSSIQDEKSGIVLAKDILNKLTQIPLHIDQGVDISRRALMTGYQKKSQL